MVSSSAKSKDVHHALERTPNGVRITHIATNELDVRIQVGRALHSTVNLH
jgi:hypothetical protein